MRNNAFIYDPSKDIAQRGRESADLAEQALRPVIQKKVNDFNMVKDLYDNIETERQNLDQFNENLINQKIDKSLGSLSQAILKDGKLDYKKIGEMKRQVSEIRLAKAKSKIVSDEFRDKVSLLYKNADKMHDINGTISEMRKTLSDPNFLFSPEDATNKLTNIYSDGVDMNRLLQSRVKELAKDGSGNYTDEKGNNVFVKAKLVPGFSLGDKGEIVPVGDEVERKRALGSLLNDQEKAVLARQLGPAMAFDGDIDGYVENMVGGILRSSKQDKIVRTAEQIQKDLVGINKSQSDITNNTLRTQAVLRNSNTQAQSLQLREKEFAAKEKGGYFNKTNKDQEVDNFEEYPANRDGSLSMNVEVDGKTYTKFGKNPGGTYFAYTKGSNKAIPIKDVNGFRSQLNTKQKKAFDSMGKNPQQSTNTVDVSNIFNK